MKGIKPHSNRQDAVAVAMIWLMISVVATPLAAPFDLPETHAVSRSGETPWASMEQPWPQYARTPTHNPVSYTHLTLPTSLAE